MRIREAKGCFDAMAYDSASWCAVYFNNWNRSVVEITHGIDKFSRAAYNGLIQSMFIDACGDWESSNLTTYVFNHSGKLFCYIRMVTHNDGSEIWSTVYVNGERVRDMWIAQ